MGIGFHSDEFVESARLNVARFFFFFVFTSKIIYPTIRKLRMCHTRTPSPVMQVVLLLQLTYRLLPVVAAAMQPADYVLLVPLKSNMYLGKVLGTPLIRVFLRRI